MGIIFTQMLEREHRNTEGSVSYQFKSSLILPHKPLSLTKYSARYSVDDRAPGSAFHQM